MANFSWKDAPDLMARLSEAQNHCANINQDIMTFAGFCNSRDELEGHVCRYEIRAQNYEQDREHRRAALARAS